MKKYYFLFALLGISVSVFAQNRTMYQLDEVLLHASPLKEFSNSQHVRVFNDSLVETATSSLTDLLKYHTPIYFKENGLGMVSSVSFRGTTAQQTAVVWNGININSKLLGQTDFNTINISGYDAVVVRSGGGSVLYGSGAIGGSVHLKSGFHFNQGLQNEVKLGYGSFNTRDARYKFTYSGKNTSVQLSVGRASSDNDYPYLGTDRKNLNGQYHNTAVNAGVAYKINPKNTLKFRTTFYDGERHFSLVRPTENRTKYDDFHTWNLLGWTSRFGNFTSKLKVAYLKEAYKYFGNIESDNHTHGKAETYIGKYNLGLALKNDMEIHGLLNYAYTKGEGSSIPLNKQRVGSVGLLLKQELANDFLYEIGAKKEFSQNYDSPFLFSAGLQYQLTDFYGVKLNYSKNYRIPTFNDMYWEGSGNTNLRPETAHQIELGNYFRFRQIDFSLTGFLINIKDMIHWVPTSGGPWKPQNTSEVQSYGLESNLRYAKQFGNHRLNLHGSYGYTVSKNKKTNMQLTYVPYHKATLSFGYAYQDLSFTYNFLYNGEVFTRTDNDEKYNMPAYAVSNVGLAYSFGKSAHYGLRFQVKNLFNKKYQSVVDRYMPGRHYSVYLTFKF